MELSEEAECPVCYQSYDNTSTIPRVVPCGHTICQTCLSHFPQIYPLTIRCPICTQLVKFPSHQGPSSLPKNIDLLRLVKNPSSSISHDPLLNSPLLQKFEDLKLSRLWSHQFYAAWNPRILDKDDDFIKEIAGKVSFLKLLSGGYDESVVKVSYKVKVLSMLNCMKEEEREELGLFFRRFRRVCEIKGLWGDVDSGELCLVSERGRNGDFLKNWERFEEGFGREGLCGFGVVSMEMCEAVYSLHLEGMVLGCLGLSCFEFDDFGHVKLSLTEAVKLGRSVRESVGKSGFGGRRVGSKDTGELIENFLKSKLFMSPEVFLEMLKSMDLDVQCGGFEHPVDYSSDVWTLGFILLTILVGRPFVEMVVDHVKIKCIPSEMNEANSLEYSCFHEGLQEKVDCLLQSKFGEEFGSMRETIHACLNFDPSCRPHVVDVWKSVKKLIKAPQFDAILQLDRLYSHEHIKLHCLVNSNLCQSSRDRCEAFNGKQLHEVEKNDGNDVDHKEETNVDISFAQGLMRGNLETKDMCGHQDCVTGLAIGSGFLFSSSLDKSIHVWSLQNFSHVHRFKGHEHKVMTVIYVDKEEPVCVSGDSGGGIFVWNISTSLGDEPLRKWYEEKDWQYRGIRALAAAGDEHLYTGGGDKSIRKWSLQDGTLSVTLEGHKSIVSALVAYNGVLYSGSWDGTIRLWSLNDDSLLTVLGDDMPAINGPVMSLSANGDTLIAGYESGQLKIWRNDNFMKSIKLHNAAIFALAIEGNWLFSGGWDKSISVQELFGDEFNVDLGTIGSIPSTSIITALSCWKGMLFAGYGDGIKVFYNGSKK